MLYSFLIWNWWLHSWMVWKLQTRSETCYLLLHHLIIFEISFLLRSYNWHYSFLKFWNAFIYFLNFLHKDVLVLFLRVLLLVILVLVVLQIVVLVVVDGWNSNILILDWSSCSCNLIHFVHVFLLLIIWQCIILLSSDSSITLFRIHWNG